MHMKSMTKQPKSKLNKCLFLLSSPQSIEIPQFYLNLTYFFKLKKITYTAKDFTETNFVCRNAFPHFITGPGVENHN